MTVQATKPVNYSGVFDRSIYDQTTIKSDATEIELIEHLLVKKKERLNTVLLNTAKQRLDTYKKITEQGNPFTDNKRSNEIYNTWLRPLLSSVININGLDQVRLPIEREDARKKVFELAFEIELMMNGLDKEQIGDLEQLYVLKKRNIPSQELKDEIEDTLLIARDTGVPLQLVRKFIENSLCLSSRVASAVNTDITRHECFKNYDPDLQYRLKCVAQKFITDSKFLDCKKGHCNRSIYYFYGNPSSGKSTAAKMIPELLDLPFYVYTIRSSEDLSRENLEGKSRSFYEANNPGLLGYALLRPNSNNEQSINVTLILEDFDRILFSDNVQQSLAFLLDFLDPEKKDFFSPYFNAKLNIAWLSIIITANQRIPQKPKNHAEKDPYAALRSRVTEIHFPDFPESKIKSICTPYAETIGEIYNIAPDLIMANKTKWIDQAIQKQHEQSHSVELRDVKRRIELEVIEELIVPEPKVKKQRTDHTLRNLTVVVMAVVFLFFISIRTNNQK